LCRQQHYPLSLSAGCLCRQCRCPLSLLLVDDCIVRWQQSYGTDEGNDDNRTMTTMIVSCDDNDCTVSIRTAINNVRPSYEDDDGDRWQRTQQLTYRIVRWQRRQSDDDNNQQWSYRTMQGGFTHLREMGNIISLSLSGLLCAWSRKDLWRITWVNVHVN
jgi:hypothetical protein